MSKKIFLFADGTGNAFSSQESNVWRLYQALDTSGSDVVAKYIPGVGTSSFKPWAILDAATGIGVPANVRQLYGFLCDKYVPGDAIYMFGFSRGAFTIRTLIGLIASQGIVNNTHGKSDEETATYQLAAWRNYRAEVVYRQPWYTRPSLVHVAWIIEKTRQYFFRSRYKQPLVDRNVKIQFVGLFDTVEAFGVPVEEMRIAIDRVFWPISFRNDKMSTIAQNVRHALSLDDERTSFHPLRVGPSDEETLEQASKRIREVWFSGVHSDVGGGYPEGYLSYVPLLWMVDELRSIDHSGTFRPEQVTYWEDRHSPYAPKHDSRSTVGVLYRYAPRNARPFGLDQKPLEPIVHHSVIQRMAFGYDRYAPTPLPATAQVWLPNGEICQIASPGGQLPENVDPKLDSSRSLVFKAIKALDGPKQELLDWACDKIWRRRVGYFVMLALLGACLALPYYGDQLSDWLFDMFGRSALPRWWMEFWHGIGRGLGPIAGAIVPNVAGYVEPYITVLRKHPAISLSLISLSILNYKRSVSIANDISELISKAWTKEGNESRPEIPGIYDCVVRKIRTNRLITFLHHKVATFAIPAVWALVLSLVAVALASRLAFEFETGTNWTTLCVETKDPRRVTEGEEMEAQSFFATNNVCWASGLEVEKGQDYRLTLTLEDPWIDRTVLTDARGFEPSYSLSEPGFFLLRPYLRWPFNPWFRPIARVIGKYGDDEWPLSFCDASEPYTCIKDKSLGFGCRYDNSSEYCEAHGYKTHEECARHPIQVGLYEPLPKDELPIAKAAIENVMLRTAGNPRCLGSEPIRTQFVHEFTAPQSGELFMFVNDVIPIARNVIRFYGNNLGTARVTLQKKGPSMRQ